MVGGLAIISVSSGLVELSKTADLKWIFIGVGAFSIVVGFIMIFGIKDVISTKSKAEKVHDSSFS